MTKYVELLDDLISLVVGHLSSIGVSNYQAYVLGMVLIHLRTARSLINNLR